MTATLGVHWNYTQAVTYTDVLSTNTDIITSQTQSRICSQVRFDSTDKT